MGRGRRYPSSSAKRSAIGDPYPRDRARCPKSVGSGGTRLGAGSGTLKVRAGESSPEGSASRSAILRSSSATSSSSSPGGIGGGGSGSVCTAGEGPPPPAAAGPARASTPRVAATREEKDALFWFGMTFRSAMNVEKLIVVKVGSSQDVRINLAAVGVSRRNGSPRTAVRLQWGMGNGPMVIHSGSALARDPHGNRPRTHVVVGHSLP